MHRPHIPARQSTAQQKNIVRKRTVYPMDEVDIGLENLTVYLKKRTIGEKLTPNRTQSEIQPLSVTLIMILPSSTSGPSI